MAEARRGPSTLEAMLAANAPGERGRASLARRAEGFAHQPAVTVLVAIEELDEIWAKATVRSALEQVYPWVDLVVAARSGGKVAAGGLPPPGARADRMAIVEVAGAATSEELRRAAFDRSRGELVTFVAHGDLLAPDAIYRCVELLQRVPADVVYTDEDEIDEFDRHHRALAKPYWCPDLAPSETYPGGMALVRREPLARALDEGGSGREAELGGRLAAGGSRVVHLPRCLYHRRRGLHHDAATERPPAIPSARRPDVRAEGPGRVSAIVLAPGERSSPIGAQLGSLSEPTAELIFVTEATPADDAPVRSTPAALANDAAARAGAEFLLFVDGRATLSEESEPGWLAELVALADDDRVGAVGGAMLDPEGRWLQAGLRPGLGALATPQGRTAARPELADRICNPLALCAAPMLIRRSVFESLGGFDAERFGSSLFDADLSLRASRAGLRNVYSPAVAARVPDARAASDEELGAFLGAWAPELSLISAYDGCATRATQRPGRVTAGTRGVLRPDNRVEPVDCGLALGA